MFMYRRPFVYAHVWKPHQLVLWDNRCIQHSTSPPMRSIGSDEPGYASIGDTIGNRRIVCRTYMIADWTPSAEPLLEQGQGKPTTADRGAAAKL